MITIEIRQTDFETMREDAQKKDFFAGFHFQSHAGLLFNSVGFNW